MRGLDPRIHGDEPVSSSGCNVRASAFAPWIAGSSPAMTTAIEIMQASIAATK
jgi:hypothetical protein